MTTMRVDELREHLDEALARVRAGETVEIADEGHAIARLAPCAEPWEQALGIRRATFPMEGFEIPPIPLDGPVDAVALVRAERRERDLLP